jgi:hypothetical protein
MGNGTGDYQVELRTWQQSRPADICFPYKQDRIEKHSSDISSDNGTNLMQLGAFLMPRRHKTTSGMHECSCLVAATHSHVMRNAINQHKQRTSIPISFCKIGINIDCCQTVSHAANRENVWRVQHRLVVWQAVICSPLLKVPLHKVTSTSQ